MKYSATTGGFYSQKVHGASVPADAVEITDEQHQALLAGQAAGKVIRPGDGNFPVLQDAPALTSAERRATMPAVSKLQAKKALEAAGIWTAAKAVLAADPDLQEDWDLAQELRRQSPMLLGVAATLGLTDAQLDDLFAAAATIAV